MMRFAQLTWIGLGTLLVLPGFAPQNRASKRAGIEKAVAETVGVLAELAGLQQALEQGDARPLGRLRELTEPPILDAPLRDRTLAELRVAVSALQMQLDSGGEETDASPWESGRTPGTTPLNLQALGRMPARPAADTGSTRVPEAADGVSPGRGSGASPTGVETARSASERAGFEPAGYSADRLRQARLSILADRPADALALLEQSGEASEIVYWRARALEELGEIALAIDAYRKVAGDEAAGSLAARAAQDLAFLEWKRDFDARRAGRARPSAATDAASSTESGARVEVER